MYQTYQSVLPNQSPVPPVEMVMPQLANQIYAIASLTFLFIVAIILLRASLRQRSPVPILFLLGGVFSYIAEPFFDINVCVWYPEIGTDSFYRLYNVSVPIWVIGAFGLYMGGISYWVYRKFIEGISASELWKLYPIFLVANLLLEIPGLQLGIYNYYGPQAFKLLGFPLWMGFANAGVPISIAATIFALRNFLTGPRVWLIPLVIVMSCITAEVLAGWPMWFTLNSGAGRTATMLATIPVLCLTCMLVYFVSYTVCVKKQSKVEAHF